MTGPMPRDQYPWWVKVSLWGLPSRAAVWAFVWISIALAIGCVCYAALMSNRRMFTGILFLIAAFMYWISIRWVDRHGSWNHDKN